MSCTPDIRNAGSGRPASRAIASDTRGGGRSDRAGLPWSGCDPLAGCSGVVGHRLPPRTAAIRDRGSARHAYALPSCVPSASWSSSLPVSLLGSCVRKRRGTPSDHQARRQYRAGGVTSQRSTAPAPQSNPVAPASRLVAHGTPSVAFGLGLRILAAGPAHLRLYSDCGRLCEPDLKVCSGSSAGAGIGWFEANG